MDTTSISPNRQPRASVTDMTAVLHVLLGNQHRYVKRNEIAETTGINERIVRDAIAGIIDSRLAPVVPNRGDGGYRICTDPDLILSEVRRLKSQIVNTVRRIEALEELAADPLRAAAMMAVLQGDAAS